MADMLQNGAAWLAAKLKAKAGRAITYKRRTHTASLTATVGQTMLRLSDDTGEMQVVWTDRDYLLTPADLILNGSVVLPEKGDIILDATDGTTQRYEVFPYGNEPVHKLDAHSALLRIHTKHVGAA